MNDVDEGSTTGAPRWVRVSGIIAIVLVVVFVIVHVAGGGLGHHLPPADHTPAEHH